jgi:hypothetical protein
MGLTGLSGLSGLSGIAGAAWTPKNIAGLALWLDASDASTLFQDSALTTPAVADTDPIGGWLDKSGNGRNALQATALQRGRLRLNIINGKPVWANDVNDELRFVQALFAQAQPATLYCVFKKIDSGTRNFITASATWWAGLIPNAQLGLRVSSAAITYDGTIGTTTPYIAKAVLNGATSKVGINADAYTDVDLGTSANMAGMTVGARGGTGTESPKVYVAEVLCYSGDVTANDAAILAFLNAKWAVY